MLRQYFKRRNYHNRRLQVVGCLRFYAAIIHNWTRIFTCLTYLRMSLSDERRLEEVPGCSTVLYAPITSCVLNTLRLFDRAKSWRRHLFELFLLWFPFMIIEADVDKFICCCWLSEFCMRLEESSWGTAVLLKYEPPPFGLVPLLPPWEDPEPLRLLQVT